MATDREIQELVLRTVGREEIVALRAAIETEEAALRGLISTYGTAAVQTQAFQTRNRALLNSLADNVTALQQAERRQRDFGRSALYASYALQDFTSTQGGFLQKLNSIQNNLPQIVMAFGGTERLAGALSIAAIGAGLVIQNFDRITAAFESRVKFPALAGDVTKMKKELELLNKELGSMNSQESLRESQLGRYNKIRARTAELEKQIADEMERQAKYKQLMESKSKEDEQRAAGFDEAVKGQGVDFKNDLTMAIANQISGGKAGEALQQARDKRQRDLGGVRDFVESGQLSAAQGEKMRASIEKEFAEKEKRIRKGFDVQAEELIKRVQTGNAEAFKKLMSIVEAADEETLNENIKEKLIKLKESLDPEKVIEANARKTVQKETEEQAALMKETEAALQAKLQDELRKMALEGLANPGDLGDVQRKMMDQVRKEQRSAAPKLQDAFGEQIAKRITDAIIASAKGEADAAGPKVEKPKSDITDPKPGTIEFRIKQARDRKAAADTKHRAFLDKKKFEREAKKLRSENRRKGNVVPKKDVINKSPQEIGAEKILDAAKPKAQEKPVPKQIKELAEEQNAFLNAVQQGQLEQQAAMEMMIGMFGPATRALMAQQQNFRKTFEQELRRQQTDGFSFLGNNN